MLFSSTIFLYFFLPLVLILYFLIPRIFRNIFLLFFSILFYLFSSSDFILILLISIFINYLMAHFIAASKLQKRKFFLIIGITINLGVLFYFKYLGFFAGGILSPMLGVFGLTSFSTPIILIPLALSFYTFHALSYLIDVYQNKIIVEKKLTRLALYFLLFPHLIAGPIVRFGEIYDQLNKRIYSLSDFSYGVRRFIIGLGKKVLIADLLGPIADEIFNIPPANMTTETAWLGVICFTLQIYFDFSGYSDMAIGLARMFGFKFPENFNYPYIATSIGEFWNRWHMTLYRWFRDYVYIPLGGNRRTPGKNFFNIIFVFFLTGLWHGAGWHYIAWGLIQAFFIILERLKGGLLIRYIWMPFRHIYALLAIMISWVFFRSESLNYTISFLNRLFIDFSPPKIEFRPFNFFLNEERIIVIILAVIISSSVFQILLLKVRYYLSELKIGVFELVYGGIGVVCTLIVLIISMLFIVSQTYNPFIYFKF